MRIVGPVLIIVASFVVATALYGILIAANLSEDSAAAIAQTVGGLAILGLGLRSYSRLPAHERRYVLARKRSFRACILVGIGLAFVLRIVAPGSQDRDSLTKGAQRELRRLMGFEPILQVSFVQEIARTDGAKLRPVVSLVEDD